MSYTQDFWIEDASGTGEYLVPGRDDETYSWYGMNGQCLAVATGFCLLTGSPNLITAWRTLEDGSLDLIHVYAEYRNSWVDIQGEHDPSQTTSELSRTESSEVQLRRVSMQDTETRSVIEQGYTSNQNYAFALGYLQRNFVLS